jgi:uncharacterized protein RhaS with RHS repeats
MNFHNRQYDPQLGRFLSVDPLAASTVRFSPYAGMNNNPVSLVDPLGLSPFNTESYFFRDRVAPIWGSAKPKYNGPGPEREESFGTFDRACAEKAITNALIQSRMEGADATLGDAGGGGGTGTLANNDAAATSDGDDGKKTPMGPFIDGTDTEKQLPEGGKPRDSKDPKKRSHGQTVYTVDQFKEYNEGRSYQDIINQRQKSGGFAGGPLMRYVLNPDDGNIMDMRHVLVVGYQVGNAGGAALEIFQSMREGTRASAFDAQDYYSNSIGAGLFDYVMDHSSTSDFTTNFYNYINTRNWQGAEGSW